MDFIFTNRSSRVKPTIILSKFSFFNRNNFEELTSNYVK